MTNEELVTKYQSGDVFALDELIVQNKGLVMFISNKYCSNRNYFDQDDIEQQGWIGFFNAVKTYCGDLPNAAAFSTYAVKCVKTSILRLFILRQGSLRELSLQEPIDEDRTIADILPDPEAEELLFKDYDRRELRKSLEDAMDRYLTLRQKEILKMLYGWDGLNCWSYREVGKCFGISVNTVNGSKQRAFRALRHSTWGRQVLKYRQIKKISRIVKRTEDVATYLADIEAQWKIWMAAGKVR